MSTIGYGPLWRIDGPPPIAPAYGLLQAASVPGSGVRVVPDTDALNVDRWINGVEVQSYPSDVGRTFDSCPAGSDLDVKAEGDGIELPQFAAFTVYLPEKCSSPYVWDQEAYKARALAVLGAVEGAAVANELLTGSLLPLNPNLSDGQGTFPNGDDLTSVLNGLALLEMEIAASGRAGVIHCSPAAVTFLRDRYAVDNANGLIKTVNGITVIPDFGYAAGATPAGHPAAPSASSEWMYASGPIDIRRSEMFVNPETVAEALDRANNEIVYRAERYYVVDWDTTVQAAVLVDRCQTDC